MGLWLSHAQTLSGAAGAIVPCATEALALECVRGVMGSGAARQVDPTLTRADRLVGQVLGEVGALPDVYTELEINFFLLRRLLGVRTQARPHAPAQRPCPCMHPAPPVASGCLRMEHWAALLLRQAGAAAGRGEAGEGEQAEQERGAHAQHRLHVHRRARACGARLLLLR